LFQAHQLFADAHELMKKDRSQAIALFEQSRDLFSALGDRSDAAIAEVWAAQTLRDVGKIDEARERLTAIAKSAQENNFLALLPTAYYWLGMNDYSQGRFSESAKSLRTALRWAEMTDNVFEIQHAEDALAKNYAKLGELEPALTYAGKTFAGRSVYYQSQNQYWRNIGTLAELTLKLDLSATSLSVAKEALSFAVANSYNDVTLNDSLRHVIDASLANHDLDGARRYAYQSLDLAAKHAETPETAVTRAEIYRALGDIDRQASNCNEAVANYDQALEYYRRLPETSAGAYQIHKGKLTCFQLMKDASAFDAELQVVMRLAEEYRRNIREDSSRQAFFDSQQEVFDAAIENAIGKGDVRGAFNLVEQSRARSLLQFVQSPKPIAQVEREFAEVARPLTLAEIQARIPEQVQLVEYAVLPGRLAIWSVSKTQFDFQEKQIPAAELEQAVDDYQSLILGKATLPDLRRAGQRLFELLIPGNIRSDKQLCLAPDRFLHRLAFATLISSEEKYLLEDHILSYAPSASVLVVASENARQRLTVSDESLLAVGNPDFDRFEHPDLPDLRDAESEARTIATFYSRSNLLVGEEASKRRFLSSYTGAGVIHFAGHFLTNPQAPANSKLLLADDDLRSAELGATRLPKTKLVVLSACATAFERFNRSEGSIGAARTFLALGVPLVVASQWKVESAATRDLMIAFHRGRKQSAVGSAESLRQAQLGILKKPEWNAPFYWAAFSIYGGYASY
jgi:CHAT domain-containing protein